MSRVIDINCDMGESFGSWTLGHDAEVMPLITSANVACGAHAGDPHVMERTVLLAKQYGVSVGAHPGYPDLQGFGRRHLALGRDELRRVVLVQIGALYAVARGVGVSLSHVKPHGALYNRASIDAEEAIAIVDAVRSFSTDLLLYCLPGSQLEREAVERGVQTVSEGFIDRRYEPNGSLVDRHTANSVLTLAEDAQEQALSLVEGRVRVSNGSYISLKVGTMCVHGDNPEVVLILRAVRATLEEAGHRIAAPRMQL